MYQRTLRRRRYRSVVISLLLIGCSSPPSADYSDVDLIDVTGRVTLDGVALHKARVAFESPDQTSSWGLTNQQGEYWLMFNSEQSGCRPGKKVVRITMFAGDNEEDPDAEDRSGVIIPACYHVDSILSADVADDATRFNFDLTSNESSAE